LAAARDRLQIPADTIIVLDDIRFHDSAIVIEMLELRWFEHKFLPPYSPFFNGIECMFFEWKHYVKVGLRHIGNNCASYTEGVRVFDN